MASLNVTPDQIAQARNAGYSDQEIVNHLSAQAPDQFEAATKAGYSPTEIIDHFAGNKADTQPSGYIDQMKQGVAEGLGGIGKTLDVHSSAGGKVNAIGKWLEKYGATWAPTNFQPANLFDEGGFHPSNIGLALAHGAPATGAVIGAAGVGAMAAPEALAAAAPIAAGAGASWLMGAGNEAQEAADKRTGQPNSPVTGSDLLRGDLTAGAESAVGALPVARYLKGASGPLEATGAAGVARALKQLGITSADQAAASGGADVVHQVGQSVGTQGGTQINPNEVANAAAGGAVMGPVFGAKGAVRESLDAMKYKALNTPELRQAATRVANRVDQNTGGQNIDGSVLFTGNAQRVGEQAVKKTGLDIQTELGNAVSDLRSRATLPVDADNILNAALKGQRPTDDGYAQLAAAMSKDPQGANVMNLLYDQHAFDVLNNSGQHINGKFRGGLGGFAGHMLSGENVTKSGLAAIGGAAFEGGAGDFLHYSPKLIAAALGARALGRLADNLTGAQSPAGRFVRNFADGSTPIRMNVPQAPAPAAPGAEPTPFPRGPVAGGNGTLPMIPPAIQAQMNARANLAKLNAQPDAPQSLNPLSLPASITGPAKNIMRGAKLRADALGQAEAQKEIESSPYIEQKLNGAPMPTPAAAKFMRQGMGSANTLARIQSDPEAIAEAKAQAKADAAVAKLNGKAKGAEAPVKEQEVAPQIATEQPLKAVAIPSKTLRPDADPRATEVQLVDDKGTPHYRGEITNEGNGLFGVGYVENQTRAYSGKAVDLYKAMAKEAERQGGYLIGGMNANKLSKAVHDKLIEQRLATPVSVGGRQLLKITSSPAQAPAPQVTKLVKANGTTQRNDEAFPPSSYGHLSADEASRHILKQAQDSGKFIRIPEKYRASTQTRIERERIAVAAIRHQHPNLPTDLAARLEATSNQAEAQAFREHYKQAYPETANAFDKHLSDEKIASLWTKKKK